MAKFHVGQRVKMVRPVFAKNMGIVGTITKFIPLEESCIPGKFINCEVAWENNLTPWAHTDQLEPLNPPKQELGSWDALRDLGLNVDSFLEEHA